MKKRTYGWILFLFIGVLLLGGCSKGSKLESMDMAETESEMPKENASGAMDFGMDGMYDVEEDAVEEEYVTEESGEAQAETIQESSRKLIKRQYITAETLEFDSFASMIKAKTEHVGGYIEHSSVSGNSYYSSGRRYASYTIRIPVEHLEQFVNGIQENCNVTDYSESVEDITLHYVDTASRIEALEIEQESLMKMLQEEGDLDTILRIQSRLTEVRYELQSYESQMRVYDNQIEYSTVQLDVYEVERATSKDEGGFGTRLMERLSDSFYGLGQGLENFALFILGGIPYWILLAFIVGVILFIRKKIRGRKAVKQILKETSLNQVYQEVNPIVQEKKEDTEKNVNEE